MIAALFFLLTLISWCYWAFAWWCVRAFFRVPQRMKADFTPPVSLLKPVKGLDPQAYENFLSFAQQDYPEYEILFGVLDLADPAVPLIERLRREFSNLNIRLLIASPLGSNHKVSILHLLAAQASYEVLVISDSDMRVTPDYLRRVVAPLADPQIGLVTCLYKGAEAENLTARLEGLYIGVTYLPSILVGRRYLSMRFALGATIALRRSQLTALGGFPALADYLADDYELGARIGSLGWKIHLSSYVILDMLGAPSLRELWHRQVRWARCIRVSRGPEYLGLIITFTTPLALATAISSSLDSWGLLTVATSLVLRWGLSWLVLGYTDDQVSQRSLLWLPLSDIFTFLVWCGGGVGRKVIWRDEAFELTSGGRMRIPA